jgi:multidrug resistance efflux pump
MTPEINSPPQSRMAHALAGVDGLAEFGLLSAEYYGGLLQLMSAAVGAQTGRIWRLEGDAVEVALSTESQVDGWDQERTLARDVFQVGLPAVWQDTADPPTAPGLVLVPLTDNETCFAVASFRVPGASVEQLESNAATLSAIAERVGRSLIGEERFIALKSRQAADGVGRYLDVKPMAYNVVNRLANYLDVDRVSLALRRGNQCRVKAISNQAVFDARSKVVRCQERLAAQVARTGEPLRYPPEEGGETAPALQAMFEKYFEHANTGAIILIPLFGDRRRREDPEDMAAIIQPTGSHHECVGVLIVEGVGGPLDATRVFRRWERVCLAVSQAVANSRQYDGLWLMPLWRTLGAFADLYRGHTQRKALLATAAVVAIACAVTLIPGDFKVRGEGVIQPRQRQHVYAEIGGTIEQLRVTDGDDVAEGDLLLTLKNPELAARVAEIAGKLREAETQLRMLTLRRVSQAFENEEQSREALQAASRSEARVKSLREQLDLLRQTERQLQVAAPIDGKVITWGVAQRLKDRPVKPGERLLTIAVPRSKWEIELRIPDRRSGYLLEVWEEHRATGLPVNASFVLTSDVSVVYQGQVVEVAPSSNVDDKELESVVRVRIEMPDDALAGLGPVKPGTSVIGHVCCGRASLGYCKLYEFFDWARRMWFRFIA